MTAGEPQNVSQINKVMSYVMKQYRIRNIFCIMCIIFLVIISCIHSHSDKIHGTLRVSNINPRYFTDDRGKAVYLTGSHTWNNLLDMSPSDPPEKFDFVSYIQWMKKYNHNFYFY